MSNSVPRRRRKRSVDLTIHPGARYRLRRATRRLPPRRNENVSIEGTGQRSPHRGGVTRVGWRQNRGVLLESNSVPDNSRSHKKTAGLRGHPRPRCWRRRISRVHTSPRSMNVVGATWTESITAAGPDSQ